MLRRRNTTISIMRGAAPQAAGRPRRERVPAEQDVAPVQVPVLEPARRLPHRQTHRRLSMQQLREYFASRTSSRSIQLGAVVSSVAGAS